MAAPAVSTNAKVQGLFDGAYTIITRPKDMWVNTLTSALDAPIGHASATIWDTLSPLERYLYARTVNLEKATRKAPLFNPAGRGDRKERVSMLSYLEAVFRPSSLLIKSFRQNNAVTPYEKGESTFNTLDEWVESLKLQYMDHTQNPAVAKDVKTNPELILFIQQNAESATIDFMQAQFTFILAIAKKGDVSREFNIKTMKNVEAELNMPGIMFYQEEVSFISRWFNKTAGLTANQDWADLFAHLKTAAGSVERMTTAIDWAAQAGTTKLQIVAKAYNRYPTFPWEAVNSILPGQLDFALTMWTTAKTEPYRAFFNGANSQSWPCSSFNELAAVCEILLTKDGERTLSGYMGLSGVNLPDRWTWISKIEKYLSDRATDKFKDFDKKTGHITNISFT